MERPQGTGRFARLWGGLELRAGEVHDMDGVYASARVVSFVSGVCLTDARH